MKVFTSISVLLFTLGLVLVQSRNIKQEGATGNPGGEKGNGEGSREGGETPNKGQLEQDGDGNSVGTAGCSVHVCAPGSRCFPAESSSVVHDTGLTYTCRCPRNMVGIFCSVPRELACHDCSGSNFYCLPTNMHWSGRFCYNTSTWARVIDGNCGRWDFSCDRKSRCVAPVSLCDGINDCEDGTDEKGPHCPDSSLRNSSGQLDEN